MFSDKKTPSPDLTKEQNKIAQGTTFKGDIQSKGSFRIEGRLEGSITTDGKIVIGKSGVVEGNINCDNADFEGTFIGELNVKSRLSLRSTAKIEGEVIVDQLSIEPGAIFNATCKMKGAVKSISNNAKQPKQKEESA
jgi:cytoskeletal protein CcmA (bactofilin family)